jgi:uncharacterized membrane protein
MNKINNPEAPFLRIRWENQWHFVKNIFATYILVRIQIKSCNSFTLVKTVMALLKNWGFFAIICKISAISRKIWLKSESQSRDYDFGSQDWIPKEIRAGIPGLTLLCTEADRLGVRRRLFSISPMLHTYIDVQVRSVNPITLQGSAWHLFLFSGKACYSYHGYLICIMYLIL